MQIRAEIKQLHLELAEERGITSTYCPSEVARKLEVSNWRDAMDMVRQVADELIAENINRMHLHFEGLEKTVVTYRPDHAPIYARHISHRLLRN